MKAKVEWTIVCKVTCGGATAQFNTAADVEGEDHEVAFATEKRLAQHATAMSSKVDAFLQTESAVRNER